MSKPAPQLAMVAGEASGDLLAGMLLEGLQQRLGPVQAAGIGGPLMAKQGFEAWWPHDELSVHGFNLEVLRRVGRIWRIRRQLGDRLLRERPKVFIGVDAPDFNFGLEARLKGAGIKTVHYVSPSIWAWRGGRIHKIARAVDHMLCLLPFEPQIYHRAGIEATFVGHPLAEAIPMVPPRAQARTALGLDDSRPVVAVLPGSRGGEVRLIAPAFLQAARLLHAERPDLQFILPAAPGQFATLNALLQTHAPEVGVQLLQGQSHAALAACDVTLIASGTATLEAALFKRPMVIAYRVSPMSWQIMRRLAYLPWVGLPNVLAREFLVPERLQDQAHARQLADDVLAWLDDPQRCAQLGQRFEQMHLSLRCQTAEVASDVIAKLID